MKKSTTAVTTTIAIGLALASLFLAGCSMLDTPMAQANRAINDANGHFKRYQASNGQVQKLAAELENLGMSEADAKAGLDVTKQLKGELDQQTSELTQASAALGKIKSLEVDAKFKKYADLEIAAIDAELAVVREGRTLYGEIAKSYQAIRDKQTTTKATATVVKNIDKSSAKVLELSQEAKKAKDAAAAYFQQVGETQ